VFVFFILQITLKVISSPAGIELYEVQFDYARVGVFAIFRHLQKSALNSARLVIDLALEWTDQRVDLVAVPLKKTHPELRRGIQWYNILGHGGQADWKEDGKNQRLEYLHYVSLSLFSFQLRGAIQD